MMSAGPLRGQVRCPRLATDNLSPIRFASLAPRLKAEAAEHGTSGGRSVGEPWERTLMVEAVLRGRQ